MKYLFSALSVLISGQLLFSVPARAIGDCDNLEAAKVSVQMGPGTFSVVAGRPLQIPIRVQIQNPEAFKNLEGVKLSVYFSHKTKPTAKKIWTDLLLAKDSILVPAPEQLEFSTTEAMLGNYTSSVYLVSGSCGIFPAANQNTWIQVLGGNAPPDTDGPNVTDLFLQDRYQAYKDFTFEVEIDDMSPSKKSTISLVINYEGEFLFISGILTQLRGNRYLASFPAQAIIKAGSYQIRNLEIFDGWGNESTPLSNHLQKMLVFK